MAAQESARVNSLNTKLQEQLLRQSKEIASLARESIDTSTGGDSFCYLELDQNLMITAVHVGKHPLSDVTVRIVDVDTFTGAGAPDSEIRLRIGNLPVGLVQFTNQRMRLPFNRDRLRLNIFFFAKNGGWVQNLWIRMVNGQQIRALRVTRGWGKQQKVLMERVPPMYPRNADGTVWR